MGRTAQLVLVAAAYFAAAELSLLVAIPPGYATAIWPPSGIALAALLIGGSRLWPAIWLASAAANLTIDASWLASPIIATGSTLQALAIARLVERHVGVPYRFASVDAVAKFVLAAVVGAVVAPTVALLPIAALYDMPTEKLLANWLTWWQGDACGILIFTPLILAWRAPSPLAWTPRRLVEAAIFATLLVIGAHSVFSQGFARTFLTVPFVVWAAFRFGQREVTSAVAVLCATALWYTLHEQRGPFAALPLHESLVLLLLFTVTLVFTGLVLSAVLAQLDAAVADLESRVRSRTAELEQAKAEAEKASEAKSQFLANMSHELRTPLNSLLILARLLADNKEANLTGKQVKFAQTIHDAGVDLLSLINDLLDLARIESGAVKTLHFGPVRVDELREELERTFSQLAQEKGLRFAVLLDPALPAVMRTDAARVKQVVKNLLANAFKFTSQGEVRLDITLLAPGQVAFAVADTGIGIPADKQEVIFEAFRQADGTTSRKYGGTGLGLSISRELTRLLGGELRLKSVPGVGSVFTLILPLAPPAVSGESGVR